MTLRREGAPTPTLAWSRPAPGPTDQKLRFSGLGTWIRPLPPSRSPGTTGFSTPPKRTPQISIGGTNPSQRIGAAVYTAAPYNGPMTASGFFPGPENVATSESQGSGPFAGAKFIATASSSHNDLFTEVTVPGRGHRNTTTLTFFREAVILISAGTDVGQGQTWIPFTSRRTSGRRTEALLSSPASSFAIRTGITFTIRVKASPRCEWTWRAATSSRSRPPPVVTRYRYPETVPSRSPSVAEDCRTATPSPRSRAFKRKTGPVSRAVVGTIAGKLGNIATRLRVGTGENVLIGGFIVSSTQAKRVIVRAIGPSAPLPGKLSDTTLELVGPSGTIATNNDWRSNAGSRDHPEPRAARQQPRVGHRGYFAGDNTSYPRSYAD